MGIRRFPTENIEKAGPVNITATAGSFDSVLAGDADTVYHPVQAIIKNNSASTETISIYEETALITSISVAAGLTEIWEIPHGTTLTAGSGVSANISASNADVTLCYVIHDATTPITKSDARAASYLSVTTIRTPNEFGEQSKT